jgi:hypothetical protein
MAKELQKTTSKKLKLYIIKTIKDENKLPDDIPKNKCKYHLKPFEKAGLVEKVGYATWNITTKGHKFINFKELQNLYLDTSFIPRTSQKKIIRGHGFMWQIKLPLRAYLSVYDRFNLLKSLKLPAYILKTKVVKTKIRNHNIHLCKKSITIYFNSDISYYGNSAKDSYREACFELKKLIVKLEKIYSCSLKIKNNHKFKVCKNHYGDLNNNFARYYKKKGQSVRILDNGREWLIIDFSHKEYIETETTDSQRSKYDMDYIITPLMNKLHKDPTILDRLEQENKRLMNILSEQQKIMSTLIEKKNPLPSFDRFKY